MWLRQSYSLEKEQNKTSKIIKEGFKTPSICECHSFPWIQANRTTLFCWASCFILKSQEDQAFGFFEPQRLTTNTCPEIIYDGIDTSVW